MLGRFVDNMGLGHRAFDTCFRTLGLLLSYLHIFFQ